MQRTNEERYAHAKEKEVVCFLGQDCKLYYFDGIKTTSDYDQMFPIVKKKRKKRKKGFDRETLRTVQRRDRK